MIPSYRFVLLRSSEKNVRATLFPVIQSRSGRRFFWVTPGSRVSGERIAEGLYGSREHYDLIKHYGSPVVGLPGALIPYSSMAASMIVMGEAPTTNLVPRESPLLTIDYLCRMINKKPGEIPSFGAELAGEEWRGEDCDWCVVCHREILDSQAASCECGWAVHIDCAEEEGLTYRDGCPRCQSWN